MSASLFVDTNVFVYRRDVSEPEKQPIARDWLAEVWRRRAGRTSLQVLHEYYHTTTQKLRPGLSAVEARKDIEALLTWRLAPADGALIRQAWALQDRFGLSWWDALIVAAAQRTDAQYLLTEDLQHGQTFGRVRVIDPFQSSPDEILTTE